MDIKGTIINNILFSIQSYISKEAYDILQNILIKELYSYNIESVNFALLNNDEVQYDLLNRFIATKRLEGLSDNSLMRYYNQNRDLLIFLNKPINQITSDDIRFYLSQRKANSKLSEITIDGMRRCISTFFKYLSNENFIQKNPCNVLKHIKCQRKIKEPFTENEINLLISSCESLRDKSLIYFLITTGCRVSEVVKININDLKNNQCIVHGKGNKDRYVYLSNNCVSMVKDYIQSRKDSTPALFVGRCSRRLTKNGIEQIIHKIGQKHNIHAYPHRFRRTFATTALSKGINLYSVSKLLGHENISTTEIYLKLDQSFIKDEYMKYMN